MKGWHHIFFINLGELTKLKFSLFVFNFELNLIFQLLPIRSVFMIKFILIGTQKIDKFPIDLVNDEPLGGPIIKILARIFLFFSFSDFSFFSASNGTNQLITRRRSSAASAGRIPLRLLEKVNIGKLFNNGKMFILFNQKCIKSIKLIISISSWQHE